MIITHDALGYSELEMGEACLIHKSLLPREPLRAPTFEVTYKVNTYGDVGGDFLDYFYLADRRLGIYLGDVVGKGLPAAMYSALAMGMLRSIHKTGAEPAAVLKLFNKRLRVRPLPHRYCSTQYAVFDPVTLELRVSNAGLPFPLHLHATGCRALGEGGLPSGLFDIAEYEQHAIRLTPGDAILFYTDGLSEACDPHGAEFGTQGLIDLCARLDCRSPDHLLREVFAKIENFAVGNQHDDMTAVALKVLARAHPEHSKASSNGE
ncbi:MAG: PP2C family protein-serine/threonine phosphatase [Candidatus Acidiferrales bacterium]